MLRGSDPVKRRQWAERLERFGNSGQTVAQFCRNEGVSQPSFYQWKTKLGSKTQSSKRRGRQSPSRPGCTAKSSAFKPVHVSPPDIASGVTVRLPDGIVIEIGSDPQLLETVMSQLLDRQASGGASSC